jgi:hypothetical protein
MDSKKFLRYPKIASYVPDEIPEEDNLMYNVEIDVDHFEALTFINYMKIQDSMAAVGGFISIMKLLLLLLSNFINKYKFSFMIFKETYFGTEKVSLDMNHEIQDRIKLEKIEDRKTRLTLLELKRQKKKNTLKDEEPPKIKDQNILKEEECISNKGVYKKNNKKLQNFLMDSSTRNLRNLEISELNGQSSNEINDNNLNSIINNKDNTTQNLKSFDQQKKGGKYSDFSENFVNIRLEQVEINLENQSPNSHIIDENEIMENENKEKEIKDVNIEEMEKKRQSERIRFKLNFLSWLKTRIGCFKIKKVRKIRNDAFDLIFNKMEKILEIKNFFKMKEDFLYFKELIFGNEHKKIFKHKYTLDEIFYGRRPDDEYLNYEHLKEKICDDEK